jgi:hypothetical protein
MRRIVSKSLLLIPIAAMLLGAAVAPVAGAQPRYFSVPIHSSFVSPFYTAQCDATVMISYEGIIAGLLFTDRSGTTVREIDTQPGTTITFSAPATGLSFSFPFATTYRYTYTDGAAPGTAATVYANGLGVKVPGLPADAGAVTYGNAVVLYIDSSSGFPIVDYGLPTAFAGHINEPYPDAEIAAGCAALGF